MTKQAESVVVGYDGSERSLDAVRWAAGWAARVGRHLTILAVDPLAAHWAPLRPELPPADRADVRALAVSVTQDHPDLRVDVDFQWGDPAELLVRAGREGHDIVVGSRGLGQLRGLVVGSVSAAAVTYSHGHAVVVVPSGTPGFDRTRPIVVGFDGSPESIAAARFALDQARTWGVRMIVIAAAHLPVVTSTTAGFDATALTAAIEGLHEAARADLDPILADYPDVSVTFRAEVGPPALSLAEASADASLIVVGSRGRGGFAGLLLGSTSRAVLHAARCPVAVIRPGSSRQP